MKSISSSHLLHSPIKRRYVVLGLLLPFVFLALAVSLKWLGLQVAAGVYLLILLIWLMQDTVDSVLEVFAEVERKRIHLVSVVATAFTGVATAMTVAMSAALTNNEFVTVWAYISTIFALALIVYAVRYVQGSTAVSKSASSALFAVAVAVGAVSGTIAFYALQAKSEHQASTIVHKSLITTSPSATDWMIAWGTLIGAVGAVAALFTLVRQMRAERARRLLPPRGLLELLVSIDQYLVDISNGGQESLWFLDATRKTTEATLIAINPQILDEELRSLVVNVLSGYRECFAWAPGHNQLSLERNSDRVQKQVDAANTAHVLCEAAKYRISELTIRD